MQIQVDGLLGLLLDVSLKAALLAGVAGVLILVLRIRDANVQHRVWTMVLGSMLALPLLVNVTPGVPILVARHSRLATSVDLSPESVSVTEKTPEPAALPSFVDDVAT